MTVAKKKKKATKKKAAAKKKAASNGTAEAATEAAAATAAIWDNRIVGEGVEAADQLLANPLNPRIHPKEQQDVLGELLARVGWVQRVVVNQRTGRLIDGHARVKLALRQSPSAQIPVVYVDLSPEEEALVLAALDEITNMATRDNEIMAELIAQAPELENDPHLTGLLASLIKNSEEYDPEKYTRKIESPIYEPTGENPAPHELYDEARTDTLIAKIESETEPGEVRDFLRAAARRHTAFRYDRIAEFYAHASPEIQRLMEESALVIIDINQAIELGFVKMTTSLQEMFGEEHAS